jgi:hypothetical protein
VADGHYHRPWRAGDSAAGRMLLELNLGQITEQRRTLDMCKIKTHIVDMKR